MSYENTHCPCGGQKPTDTMLCDECLAAFADRRELATFNDPKAHVESRRHAAIILVSAARGRRRNAASPTPSTFNLQLSTPQQ